MRNLISADDLNQKNIEEIFYISDNINMYAFNKKKTVIQLFFENSTRTAISYSLSASNLSMEVINVNIGHLSLSKGETCLETCRIVSLMNPDFIIIRHKESGFAKKAREIIQSNCSIINAGDGINEHPSQALIDIYTIKKYKQDLQNTNILMCGDVINNRSARSNVKILKMMKANITVSAPPITGNECKIFGNFEPNLSKATKDIDVIMSYRYKKEYDSSEQNCALYQNYTVTKSIVDLCNKGAIVMHPGPVMPGIDISNEVLDDKKIFKGDEQVINSIKTRMATFLWLQEADVIEVKKN